MTYTSKADTELARKLEKHVYELAHEIGNRSVCDHENLAKAEKYIAGQFALLDYDVEIQSFKAVDRTVKNLIATKGGITKPEEIIIVGAHYDTCFNPGADDNASAVAGLLELAGSVATVKTDRSIKFIGFVNEEPPFFMTEVMGSQVYAKDAKARKEDIKAALILEMIGYYSSEPNSQTHPPFLSYFYPHEGNFIAVVGNLRSRKLVKKIVSSFKKTSAFPIESLATANVVPGTDLSDHLAFWEEDYRAVMITDTAFYRNPNYHCSSDTYETLDYESMAEVVKGLCEVLLELANE